MESSTLFLLIISKFWWIVLPIILFFPLKLIYFYWLRWDVWYPTNKWILMEVKPPKEILKPFKAMEDVFHILWGFYDGANWREIWCEGEPPWGPYWFSCEIVSFGGQIHFYFRILQGWQNIFESAIYSQYPDVEISLVEDYTQRIPHDVPNKEWELYAEDYTLIKDYLYPIKTYPMFFEPEGERISKEEKRIDPLDSLLEGLSKLKKDEQFWFQIVINPITNKEVPFATRGKELIDKLVHRSGKPIQRPMLLEATDIFITGEAPGVSAEEKKEFIPPEMKLTPGEREIVMAIGHKISKLNFKTWVRMVHLYKRDAPYSKLNTKLARSYFLQFATQDLNGIRFWDATRTRIHYFLKKRRLHLRKRRLFRLYRQRLPSTFPWSMEGNLPFYRRLPILDIGYKGGIGGIMILNAEELATIFHFPSKVIIPTLPYVESKKGGPPPTLPT